MRNAFESLGQDLRYAVRSLRKTPAVGLVGKLGLLLAATGVAVGTVLALGLTRLIATFLYGVKPTDPLTYAVVATGLVAVACSRVYSLRGGPS
jgi:hypothetical protein